MKTYARFAEKRWIGKDGDGSKAIRLIIACGCGILCLLLLYTSYDESNECSLMLNGGKEHWETDITLFQL